MFDWFWEFLFSISSTLFRLIDGLILCANKLCGIDTINFNGEEKDFLSYLLLSDEVGFAFRVSAILASMLLVIFTVFMVIRTITKDKAEGTPAQIAVKAFKTIVMFFFVPVVIIAFMAIGNTFLTALYEATTQSASSPGAFLFSAFAEDGGMNAEYAALFRSGELDYTNVDVVSDYMARSTPSVALSDFPFFFSFLAAGVVLFGIGSAMLIFVDRVLSLVILYIAAPISIATSMLDDGARFKLWRDQFLTKFIMGYGMLLAINIYALVCGLVMNPSFAFFSEEGTGFLNFLMKLLIIGGGALTMQKSMALVGNLVSSGAGSNELRDNALSMGGLARMAKGVAGGIASNTVGLPFRAAKSIVGDAINQQSRHLGARMLRGLGMDGGLARKTDKDGNPEPGSRDSGSTNNEKTNYGSNPNSTKDAINNDKGFKMSFGNNNTNNSKKKENSAVGKAIQNNGNNKSNNKQGDNNNQNNQTTQNNQQGG